MKKLFFLFVIGFSLFFMFACESMYEPPVSNVNNANEIFKMDVIENDEASITTEEVHKIIAKAYLLINKDDNNNSLITLNDYTLRTINDNDGNIALYIANFKGNKGFVVVSATKDYEPILALSEKGSFPDYDKTPAPLEAWKKETIIAIKNSKNIQLDSLAKFHNRWKSLINPTVIPYVSGYNNNQNRDHNTIWHNQLSTWLNAGYTLHGLNEHQITGDSQIDNLMRYYAQNEVNPGYDWMSFSVVVEQHLGTYSSYNLIQSNWQQDNHYNDSCPTENGLLTLAGCGPIAMGQVMRYYQFPANKDWANMPYNYATPTTAQFLREIGDNCYVLYGLSQSTTNLSLVKNALNYYGYNANMDYHNKSRVISCLNQNRPVIMRGTITTSIGTGEHQWVASGYMGGSYFTRYELYVMDTPTTISCPYSFDTNYGIIQDHIYMNWGWGPNTGNGFYYDNGNEIVPGTNPIYPISSRANLYDIYPL